MLWTADGEDEVVGDGVLCDDDVLHGRVAQNVGGCHRDVVAATTCVRMSAQPVHLIS